jgi:hypothetical protein
MIVMLLLRLVTSLLVGMALSVIFLGRGPDDRLAAAGAAEAVVTRSAESPASAPLAVPAALSVAPPAAGPEPEPEPPVTARYEVVTGTPVVHSDQRKWGELLVVSRADAPADMRRAAPVQQSEGAGDEGFATSISGDQPLYVSGGRVNLRSGPGTDAAVVATLTRGTLAEPTGEARDGWQRVRVASMGVDGWIAGRFLSASRP